MNLSAVYGLLPQNRKMNKTFVHITETVKKGGFFGSDNRYYANQIIHTCIYTHDYTHIETRRANS